MVVPFDLSFSGIHPTESITSNLWKVEKSTRIIKVGGADWHYALYAFYAYEGHLATQLSMSLWSWEVVVTCETAKYPSTQVPGEGWVGWRSAGYKNTMVKVGHVLSRIWHLSDLFLWFSTGYHQLSFFRMFDDIWWTIKLTNYQKSQDFDLQTPQNDTQVHGSPADDLQANLCVGQNQGLISLRFYVYNIVIYSPIVTSDKWLLGICLRFLALWSLPGRLFSNKQLKMRVNIFTQMLSLGNGDGSRPPS